LLAVPTIPVVIPDLIGNPGPFCHPDSAGQQKKDLFSYIFLPPFCLPKMVAPKGHPIANCYPNSKTALLGAIG